MEHSNRPAGAYAPQPRVHDNDVRYQQRMTARGAGFQQQPQGRINDAAPHNNRIQPNSYAPQPQLNRGNDSKTIPNSIQQQPRFNQSEARVEMTNKPQAMMRNYNRHGDTIESDRGGRGMKYKMTAGVAPSGTEYEYNTNSMNQHSSANTTYNTLPKQQQQQQSHMYDQQMYNNPQTDMIYRSERNLDRVHHQQQHQQQHPDYLTPRADAAAAVAAAGRDRSRSAVQPRDISAASLQHHHQMHPRNMPMDAGIHDRYDVRARDARDVRDARDAGAPYEMRTMAPINESIGIHPERPRHVERRPSVESYVYDAYEPPPPSKPIGKSESQLDIEKKAEKPLSRSGSLSFLGAHMQNATWLRWSQDRRASFKRRLDTLERRQKELEENRVSTPVMKARKESIMFMGSGLPGPQAASEDEAAIDVNAKLARYMPNGVMRQRGKGMTEENKLSIEHWNALVAFWGHGLFVKARYVGIVIACFCLILALVSITNQKWSIYENHETYGASYSNLWLICTSIPTGQNCTTSYEREWLGDNPTKTKYWQIAVICLLVFALAFGFIATLMAICGVCVTTLSRKLHYYHSSGEMYVICAFCTFSALVLYPASTEAEREYTPHTYGYGYLMCWGCVIMYTFSAVCLSLDELVRSISRSCPGCGDDSKS